VKPRRWGKKKNRGSEKKGPDGKKFLPAERGGGLAFGEKKRQGGGLGPEITATLQPEGLISADHGGGGNQSGKNTPVRNLLKTHQPGK